MHFGISQFSICLLQQDGAPGYLFWGQAPEDPAAAGHEYYLPPGDFANVEVVGELHWAVSMTALKLDLPDDVPVKEEHEKKKEALSSCKKGCAAIVDSGTSLIAAPRSALMEISDQVGNIAVDCSNLHELPNIKFTLDSTEFVLPPEAYIMKIKTPDLNEIGAHSKTSDSKSKTSKKPSFLQRADGVDLGVEASKLYFLNKEKVESNIDAETMCIPGFMAIDMTSEKFGDVWILGMPFLRYYFTTFDRSGDTKMLRFAKAAPATCHPEPFATAKDAYSFVSSSSIGFTFYFSSNFEKTKFLM